MLTYSTMYVYNAFGRCRWHVCAFLPTIPLGDSSSTVQMPEWIYQGRGRVRFQFESKETHMEQHKKKVLA
jgi:hypothetical protein